MTATGRAESLLDVDAEHGARITSLVDRTSFEWLWSRPDPRRDRPHPGAEFVDAGGVEECFPTLAGTPDHGSVWSRPWTRKPNGALECRVDGWTLSRRQVDTGAATVRLDYELVGEPGRPFVWAFHALVRPAPALRLDVPPGTPARTWPRGHGSAPHHWFWPDVHGLRVDDLTVDDGTAVFVGLADLDTVTVRIGHRTLRLQLHAGDQPHGFGIWRNLGGYSWDRTTPYRSFGIEPMLGRNPELAAATPEDRAHVPASGRLAWALDIAIENDTPSMGEDL